MKPITPKRHLPSTIIIGIFLAVALLIAAIVYLINYGDLMRQAAENVKEGTDNPYGQATGTIIVGIFGGAMLVAVLFLSIFIVTALSTFGLVKSIFNVKTSMGPIKVINIVYICLSGLLVLGSVVRIILFIAASI